ncbi:MAG: ABC transporter permease [Chloroflexota bacterium]
MADSSTIEAFTSKRSVESAMVRRWRSLRANKAAMASGMLVLFFMLVALAAPWIAPYDPLRIEAIYRLQPPSAAHWLGTDDFGRDVLSRVIHGTRVSMTVSLFVVALCASIGITLGLLAGYYQKVDMTLMRVLDGLMAFPGILLAIAIAAALRPSITSTIVALSIVYVPRFVRVMRAPVLVAKEAVYVDAARSSGANDLRILAVHLLPNTVAPLIVQATFTFAFAILSEAALSFLGVGVPPPSPSWGGILNDARPYMIQAPWLTVAPGVVLISATMALNLFGDGLRDALDPRHFTGVAGAQR